MAENKAHPNNQHVCSSPDVDFDKHITALTEVFTAEDYASICSFFVLHAPILKSKEDANQFGQRSLRFYNWIANAQMNKLEGMLIKSAKLPSFIMLRTNSINETLQAMNLYDKGCIEHPRAVLQQKHSVKILENGTVLISNTETRMECLFRHVRNALAHNRSFSFPNHMIMLQDEDESCKQITARILLPQDALKQWIKIIKNDLSV